MAFLVALFAPLLVGLVLGRVVKLTIRIGLTVVVAILALMFLWYIAPNQVFESAAFLLGSRGDILLSLRRMTSYIPYSSMSFVIGVAIGLL